MASARRPLVIEYYSAFPRMQIGPTAVGIPDRNNLQNARLRGGAGRTRTNHHSVMECGHVRPAHLVGHQASSSKRAALRSGWIRNNVLDLTAHTDIFVIFHYLTNFFQVCLRSDALRLKTLS